MEKAQNFTRKFMLGPKTEDLLDHLWWDWAQCKICFNISASIKTFLRQKRGVANLFLQQLSPTSSPTPWRAVSTNERKTASKTKNWWRKRISLSLYIYIYFFWSLSLSIYIYIYIYICLSFFRSLYVNVSELTRTRYGCMDAGMVTNKHTHTHIYILY